MLWNHIGRCQWECKDYRKNFITYVEPYGKSYKCTILHNDKKIKSSVNLDPINCMEFSTSYIDNYVQDNNV